MILFFQAALMILTFVTFLWIWSVFIKNVSIIDVFWGIGFVFINAFYACKSGDLTARKLLVLSLVTIWGLRLAIYLAYRNYGKGEDFRYQEFRKNFGPNRYWWFSFFQTFLLQAALIMVISLPLIGIQTSTNSGALNALDYLGIFVWTVGFIFEAGGDYQLMRFQRNLNNKGKVLDTGFWKYTRHPNYFGDAAVWWSYAIFSIASESYWQVIGAVIMTLLIIKVSGVRLLEKTLKDTKPLYSDYVKKTNSFLPWFPKKIK
jgi:steroid 5-alpha reductase family enzyme